jgi:L-seryl-tRNA(Ser) seleniumtransferase
MTEKKQHDLQKGTGGLDRREFLGAGLVGTIVGWPRGIKAQEPIRTQPADIETAYRDNIYTRLLGVRPHLPAHEHISRLGGSRMPPDVIEAMAEANNFFVDMNELTEAAGEHVAEVMGAEAALVTAGAFSAMILGAAACLTGTDPEKMEALPHPTWPRRECLIQTAHRFDYDRAYRAAGMTIVDAATREELIGKITDRTAMIAVLAAAEKQRVFGPPKPRRRALPPESFVLTPEELIEIGRKAGVPVLVDFASDVPPASHLTRFLEAGADLVVLSGGKGLRGPQSTGILAGRKDLIEAATLNAAPYGNIGRGMKVGKEEIIGLIVALNGFVELDYEKVIEGWNQKAKWLASQLQDIPGVAAVYDVNTMGYGDVDLSWDESVIPLTEDDVKKRLMEGEPRLAYDGTTVRVRCLRDGEEVLVARRLREFFSKATAK